MTAPPRRARRLRAACLGAAAILAGCAGQRDHFYALATLPESPPAPTASFTTHVLLTISLPPVIDRRQMVIATTADQLLVLEHERWAAPLSELVAQTLARDIERRRADVLVADRSFDQAGLIPVKIRVDIVRMSVREGAQATLEAHWRVVDARRNSDGGRNSDGDRNSDGGRNSDEVGGETFESPAAGGDYAAIARAFSNDLSSLADRLSAKLPAP